MSIILLVIQWTTNLYTKGKFLKILSQIKYLNSDYQVAFFLKNLFSVMIKKEKKHFLILNNVSLTIAYKEITLSIL